MPCFCHSWLTRLAPGMMSESPLIVAWLTLRGMFDGQSEG